MTNPNDVLKNMHPVKIQIIKELDEKAKGKDMKQMAPLIMEAMQKLRAQNLTFSQEEVTMLLRILTKDMTPEEKKKVEMMKKIVKDRGKK
nr:hypothetical protein [Eubacterium sp.]